MIKPSDVPIDTRAMGDVFILTGISPDYRYLNGSRTDERIGTRYEVAIPALQLEKIRVKVEGDQSVSDEILQDKDFTQVVFDNLVAHFYVVNSNVGITASADQIHVLSKKRSPEKPTV